MRHALIFALAALFLPLPALALPSVGEPAPAFSVKDIAGNTVSTEELKGKTVVLEWHNPVCPFVRKHYESENMQKLQAEATGQGTVWIAINSGSDGKAGTFRPADARRYMRKHNMAVTHYVTDPEGTLGKLYGAKTTPHMFVIDKKGKIAYMGAIDSDSRVNPSVIENSDNYVRDALQALAAGKAVQVSSTQSYGCGVKYAD